MKRVDGGRSLARALDGVARTSNIRAGNEPARRLELSRKSRRFPSGFPRTTSPEAYKLRWPRRIRVNLLESSHLRHLCKAVIAQHKICGEHHGHHHRTTILT